MRSLRMCLPAFLVSALFLDGAGAQSPPGPSQSPAPQAQTLAQNPSGVTVSLDEAIQMALQHNHSLLAARTAIQQSQAEETTANLRPNPVLLGDSQFLPVFQPSQFSADYLDNTAQFDLGVSYLFERGQKRQHRLQAAKDVTAVTRSQVADNERSLSLQRGFSVHQCRTRRINSGTGKPGPQELSGNGEHQRGALQSRRHGRGRSAEDQTADASVPDGRVRGESSPGCKRCRT